MKLQKTLLNQSEKEFFHVSGNIDYLKSFIHEGVKPIGRGLGGQKGGFYVFDTLDLAYDHVKFKMNDDPKKSEIAPQGGLIVGVTASNIQYPDWQFDMERAPELAQLLHQYSQDVCQIHDLPFLDNNKEYILSVRQESPYSNGYFCFEYHSKDHPQLRHRATKTTMDCGYGATSMFQLVCDYLCDHNEKFRQDYNALLLNSPQSSKKYTGSKKLQLSYLSWIQPKKQGQFTEHILYQKNHPALACPFLELHKKRQKSL